jgi:hypothetical protein
MYGIAPYIVSHQRQVAFFKKCDPYFRKQKKRMKENKIVKQYHTTGSLMLCNGKKSN